jgi:predicted acetyltransferase
MTSENLFPSKLLTKPDIIPATISDHPIIQNLWRFYIYDMGRYCEFNEGWEDPTDLSFTSDDLTVYFSDKTRKAFLIKVGSELAGFVLLNKVGSLADTQWNMAEFFIIAKFQGKVIGQQVAHQIWEEYQGFWEVSVIPENKSALPFWRKVISIFIKGQYLEEIKVVTFYGPEVQRYILSFNTVKDDI